MKILNKEVEFSFTDADNMEKLENSIETAQQKMEKINQNEKTSAIISNTYDIISECLDNIFGEGFSAEIFEGKKEFRNCIKAFSDLIQARNEQDKELEEEFDNLQKSINLAETKYSGNRATRRAKK